MTRNKKRTQLRRRPDPIACGIAAALGLGGGALLGAAVQRRREQDVAGLAGAAVKAPVGVAARPPVQAPVDPAAVTQAPPERQPQATPVASEPEQPARTRRRPGGLAYALALVLVLAGTGLIGVAAASQREIPQAPPPPAQTAVPPSASQAASPRAPSRSHDSFRATAPREQQLPLVDSPAAKPPSEQSPPKEKARKDSPPEQADAAKAVAEEAAPLTLPRSRPVAVEIPSIDVESVVRRIGLTDDGELESPSGAHYNDAAWYQHSPAPGSLGPSVIVGHVDSKSDGPSVFFRLGELRAGDRVKVRRADGSVAVFVIDDVRRFPKRDFPTERVYGDIDHAGLRLLTCGGPFDEVSGHYLDNVVVFASLADR